MKALCGKVADKIYPIVPSDTRKCKTCIRTLESYHDLETWLIGRP
jgi:hypothetical protein